MALTGWASWHSANVPASCVRPKVGLLATCCTSKRPAGRLKKKIRSTPHPHHCYRQRHTTRQHRRSASTIISSMPLAHTKRHDKTSANHASAAEGTPTWSNGVPSWWRVPHHGWRWHAWAGRVSSYYVALVARCQLSVRRRPFVVLKILCFTAAAPSVTFRKVY